MPRRQKHHARDKATAQDASTSARFDSGSRGEAIRNREWKDEWQSEGTKHVEQQQLRYQSLQQPQHHQQQNSLQHYKYQALQSNRSTDYGQNNAFPSVPINANLHQRINQTIPNVGTIPLNSPLEGSTRINNVTSASSQPRLYETTQRQREYQQTFAQNLSETSLNESTQLEKTTANLQLLTVHLQDTLQHHNYQQTNMLLCQPVTSDSSLQKNESKVRLDRNATRTVISPAANPSANNAIAPVDEAPLLLDDHHPSSPRNAKTTASKQNRVQNMEKTDNNILLSPKKKKANVEQVVEKKKNRKTSPMAALQSSDNDDEKSDKSPLPQNLRGDPFRSAKVKTELCRHFRTPKGCPFGDKCNYAHGEHELKYTKLMDLERAGLVDIEIFRTHPCPIWVATGSCPFDQRCSGLHDPRIASSHLSWLPHAETLVNSVSGTNANVDKLFHQQLSSVYSCSPIYNYIPKKRWKSDPLETFLAWRDLYAYVCNLHGDAAKWDYDHYDYRSSSTSAVDLLGYPMNHTIFKDTSTSSIKSELVRILIALKMRENKLGQAFAYLPTHLFCGELCMVLQTRVFRVLTELNQIQGNNSYIKEIEFDPKDLPPGSNDLIVAWEIAFGPVGDPGVRQVSVWFNIEANDMIPCTTQQAKRHKRSRHRLRKDYNEKDSQQISSSSLQNSTSFTVGAPSTRMPLPHSASTDEAIIKISDTVERIPFVNYQPCDNDAFNLVTNILIHRSQVLLFWILDPPHQRRDLIASSLKSFEHQIEFSFESQRRHWMTYTWPINQGRGKIDEETSVPPVNGEYEFPYLDIEEENPYTVHFHGKNDQSKVDVVPPSSRVTIFLLWKSFLFNMKLDKEEVVTLEELVFHGKLHSRKSRLLVLRNLSMGFTINRMNRILPKLKEEKKHSDTSDSNLANQTNFTGTISSLFLEWDLIKEHYESGPSSSSISRNTLTTNTSNRTEDEQSNIPVNQPV